MPRTQTHRVLCLLASTVFICLIFCETGVTQTSIPEPLLFSGNATVVAPPLANSGYAFGPNQFASLARREDCSMTAVLAELVPPSVQLLQNDYQNNLHQLSGLTTKGNQWTDGCPNPVPNNPAYLENVYAGKTAAGVQIFAVIDTSNGQIIDIYNITVSTMSQKFKLVQQLTYNAGVPEAFAAADVDGDGNADLIISSTASTSTTGGGFAVFLGKGDGTFQTTPAYVVHTPDNTGLDYFTLFDINGDNKLDLVGVVSGIGGVHSTLNVYFGNGNGTFKPGPKTTLTSTDAFGINLVAGDFDGDSHPDIILADGEVWLGNGDGTFRAGKTLAFPGIATSFTTADFNKDDKLDLAAVFQVASGEVGVFLGTGDGTFLTPTLYASVDSPDYITATDVDGDNNLDLVLGESGGGLFAPDPGTIFGSGGLQVLFGNGNGTFRGAIDYKAGSSTYAIGNITGNGFADILTPAALLEGNGTGTFTVHSGTQFPGLPTAQAGSVLRLADLNGDKILDAVLTTTSSGHSNAPFVALGKSGGTFATGSFLSSVPDAIDINIADVNGDKIPDLIVLSKPTATGIQLHVLLGKGNGTFGAPQKIVLPASAAESTGGRIYNAVLVKNGHIDLLVVDEGNLSSSPVAKGGVYILPGKGNGTFGTATSITSIANPFDAAIGDVNKDGNLDLVVSPSTNSGNSKGYFPGVFLGNAAGTFPAQPSSFISTPAVDGLRLAIADFNQDGNPDVAMADCCGLAFINIALGKGNGTFQASQIIHIAASPTGMQVADVSGDNLPDIITSDYPATGNTLTVLLNQYKPASKTASASSHAPPRLRP
jgi:FG-GAP-like repeat